MSIHHETIPASAGSEPSSRVLLRGELRGVATSHVLIPASSLWRPEGRGAGTRILFLYAGLGSVDVDDRRFTLREMSVVRAPSDAGICVRASKEPVEALEILIDHAAPRPAGPAEAEPALLPYSRCPTYREAIKSSSTVSRTIIPQGPVPRFCMGSVQVTGPDVVAAHRHPMLEQLFFGLPGNRCTLSADEDRIAFGELSLVHIPRGSSHGVAVEEGYGLHYLWMDFFEGDDMSYISEHHFADDNGKAAPAG